MRGGQRRIENALKGIPDIFGRQRMAVMKPNVLLEMKGVGRLSFHFPSFRQISDLLTGWIGPNQTAEEELVDPLGVGIGREARIELRRSRLDGDDKGGIGRKRRGASEERKKKEYRG